MCTIQINRMIDVQYVALLQCVAVCCSVLQCVAVCCSVLLNRMIDVQYVAFFCIIEV